MRGSSTDKDQAIYHREANEKMDKETAVQFFQWQFEDGNYNGDLRTLGNYMKYVPAEERDPELIALAKSVITEKYWSIHSGNEKYEDLVDQIEDVNSPVSKVLQALWAGEMGINPFTSRTDTLGKQIKLIERMREIVSDPERGQAYLDYFVKKCGITNLDRYPMSMLDGVYKDRDNKDKPFGLMVLARADENQAFSKDNETYDEFYKSLQANGQRLLLTEAGSDRELLAAIKNASTRQGKKIGFMLVGGHGSPDSIQLGEGEAIYRKTPKRRSEYEQDNDTHIRMTVRAARKYVEPGAEVLALSCSTGAKTDKYTFPIAESTARRTGWITKGFSRPLGFNNLKSHIKEDGRIGLTVDVHDGPLSLREREKFKGAPARVNTFHYENFRAESYDYLAKSGEK
jgi:methyl coenzyme M reductase subunit D